MGPVGFPLSSIPSLIHLYRPPPWSHCFPQDGMLAKLPLALWGDEGLLIFPLPLPHNYKSLLVQKVRFLLSSSTIDLKKMSDLQKQK